jgi:TIR domain
LAASHIFVCFSSKDEETAREVVAFLEGKGIKCWISLRDVLPGHNYQEAIVEAIEAASGIVFLFSEWSSKSGEIRKELSIGGSISAPVFPLRLSPIAPTGALRYELATRQYIDIFPNRKAALAKLASTIKKVIYNPQAEEGATAPIVPAPSLAAEQPREPIVASGSKQFEAIRSLLARHIGPIAKVLVERAAKEASTPEEFCERLGAHVSAPPERAKFVQAVQAQLAERPDV